MQPGEPGGAPRPGAGADRLSAAARGWHTVQLAVLGFVGICGVLRSTAAAEAPRVVQWLALGLAVAAFAIACLAVLLVAGLAYPIRSADAAPDGAELRRGAARLRSGVRLTVAALVLAVLATLSGWWPASGAAASGAAVELTDSGGRRWCGELAAGPPGWVGVRVTGRTVAVPVPDIAQLRPVAGCG